MAKAERAAANHDGAETMFGAMLQKPPFRRRNKLYLGQGEAEIYGGATTFNSTAGYQQVTQ